MGSGDFTDFLKNLKLQILSIQIPENFYKIMFF